MGWESWVGLVAVIVGLTIVGKKARAIVRRNAAFYAVKNILVVGLVYGILLALGVFLVSRPGFIWYPTPIAGLSILAVWGLLTAGYVGFRPDSIDWAGKARQTAVIAMVAYIATMAGLLLFAAW